jgi:peptidoglycan/xylan/chitin deacetylase (PgdA/CDA1 family)
MSARDAYVSRWKDVAPMPGGIRQKARGIVRDLMLAAVGSIALPFGDRFLRPVYCHYVFDDQRDKFEQVIVWLKSIGTFVNTDTCIDMLEGNREIDGRYFHLSFDDGLRNVLTNALPILRKHAVPAILFVPSALVSADWTTAREYCLRTEISESVIEMATWEDLREAVAAGVEVGSHTRTHARLSAISCNTALLEDEVGGSKREIEEGLGVECKYFSWPFGRLSDADSQSLEMTREAGYRACFGAFRGSVIARQTSRHGIPRHYFEVQWPIAHIRHFARGNFEKQGQLEEIDAYHGSLGKD